MYLGKEASDYLTKNLDSLADAVIKCQAKVQPDLQERYGESGYYFYMRDIKFHFKFLGSALIYLSKGLFGSYVEWVNGLLTDLKVPKEDVVINFQCFKKIFEQLPPENLRPLLIEFIDAGLKQLGEPLVEIPSFIDDKLPLAELATEYLSALLRGNQQEANRLILKAVEDGTDLRDIYLQVLEKVQLELGRLWQTNQLTVAQEHFCTHVTELVMAQLSPYIHQSTKNGRTLVATCVAGELHEIGIRMVSDFFALSGWKTYFIGANTPTKSILQTVYQRKPDLLALSVTIPWYVPEAERVIAEVKKDNQLNNIKTIVGGRAFKLDQELWKKIGADGFAPDAPAALDLAAKLF
jgi:methanogenic corrinoid protein MtbC1